MGAWLLGFLPKFAADFLARVFKDWRRDTALTEKGRLEQELGQEKATTEVLARNAEGQDAVDQMTEEQLKDMLTKP